jgi:hypothetical protein
VNDDVLTKAFSKYPSFNMARVSILPFSQLTITKFLLSYLKMIVGFGSLLHRLYGTSGQVKPKGMVSLVLLMHPIFLQR